MNHNDIDQAIRDYHWMIKEVHRLEKELDSIQDSLTAQYGVEASLPKGSSMDHDKVGRTVVRRNEETKHMTKLKGKIAFVDHGIELITNDFEKAVMLCILDGLSQFQISQLFKMSEGKISSIKGQIIKQLYDQQHNQQLQEK